MDPIIRLATDKDSDEILELLNDVFSDRQRIAKARGMEYWDWKFQVNPFGKAILTVAEVNNSIIAVNNLWPWEFEMRGNRVKALQPCDSAVHKDFRGKGLFKIMRIHGVEMARKENFSFLFNYPNEMSLKAYLSLGWHFMGEISWWVRILQPLNTLKGIFLEKKAEPVLISNQYELDIELVNKTAQRDICFDGFVKVNRIPGFHEWRYIQHPNRTYGMIHYQRGTKNSIAIFTINQKGRNREMIIVDIIGSTENTISLLKMVADAGREMNVGLIVLMNNPRFATYELWKLGFFPRKLKNMVVLPLDLNMEEIVKKYSNWSLMACMHDST